MFWVLLLVGCGAEECEQMCNEAASEWRRCLDAADQDWSDIGYRSRKDFEAGCTTWVWENRQLVGAAAVRDACVTERRALTSGCAAVEALDLSHSLDEPDR